MNQIYQFCLTLFPELLVLLVHGLETWDFLLIEASEGVPQVVYDFDAELLSESGSHQEDLFLSLEAISNDKRDAWVILVLGVAFELKLC